MKDISESVSFKTRDLDHDLKSAYATALKNPEFKKLVNTLKVKDNIAYKYTSKLERTVEELGNCQNCKALASCKNKVEGMVYYPTINGSRLEFNYVACKYMKKHLKEEEEVKSKFYKMPYEIKMARVSDIEVDKTRTKVIKWLKKFYDSYKKDQESKGLYLHGSFGSGKTYLVSAFLNELSKDGYNIIIIYYPELLRSLKESFNIEDLSQIYNMDYNKALKLFNKNNIKFDIIFVDPPYSYSNINDIVNISIV